MQEDGGNFFRRSRVHSRVSYRGGSRFQLPLPLAGCARTASRCSTHWDTDMLGHGRARFCWSCGRDVYDVASLSADDAIAVLEAEGDLSRTRLYVRHDGSVMKTDCPVGVRRKRLRRGLFAAWAVAMCAPLALCWPPRLHEDPAEADVAADVDHVEARLQPFPQGGLAAYAPTLGPMCSQAGCISGLDATLPLPAGLSVEGLRESTATLCLNGRCYSVDLEPLRVNNGTASIRGAWWTGERGRFAIYFTREERTIRIKFMLLPEFLRDGDVYDFTIRPTDGGAPLMRWGERAKYAVGMPNGPGCPPLCRLFSVDRTTRGATTL
jgi:hypothetical protein